MKIEILENQVAALKCEVEKLIKRNQKILDAASKSNTDGFDELSNTIEDVVARLRIVEKEQMESTKIEAKTLGQCANSGDTRRVETMVINTKADSSKKDMIANIHKNKFTCDECNFTSNTRMTLNKHTNTKHAEKDSGNECSLCEDSFLSAKEFKKHIDEHIEEIEGLDLVSLTKGHDLFECNLCSFESGHEDSIREHLIAHVNPQNEDISVNIVAKQAECQNKCLLDEYDDDGNYIGDNPKYMADYEKGSDIQDEDKEDE